MTPLLAGSASVTSSRSLSWLTKTWVIVWVVTLPGRRVVAGDLLVHLQRRDGLLGERLESRYVLRLSPTGYPRRGSSTSHGHEDAQVVVVGVLYDDGDGVGSAAAALSGREPACRGG